MEMLREFAVSYLLQEVDHDDGEPERHQQRRELAAAEGPVQQPALQRVADQRGERTTTASTRHSHTGSGVCWDGHSVR